MISLLFSSLLFASCPPAFDYESLDKQIEVKLDKAANLVSIASEADSVLSKLISNKSKVLLSWLERRKLMTETEDKIAREWRKYYLDNFILNQFPTKNDKVNLSVESTFNDISDMALPKEHRQQVEEIFSKTREDAVKLINSWQLTPEKQKELIAKLKTLKIYWLSNLTQSPFKNRPKDFFETAFFYDSKSHQILMGAPSRRTVHADHFFILLAQKMGEPIKEIPAALDQMPNAAKKDGSNFQDWFATAVYENGTYSKSLPKSSKCTKS